MKGVLSISFVVTFFMQPVHAANVRFADPNLEAAVEEVLGVEDPDTDDMLNLSDLVISQGLVSDLTGLEYAHNLEVLGLYRNQVNNLSPLTGLTKLRILVLKGGQVGDLAPLVGLTALEELALSLTDDVVDLSCLT